MNQMNLFVAELNAVSATDSFVERSVYQRNYSELLDRFRWWLEEYHNTDRLDFDKRETLWLEAMEGFEYDLQALSGRYSVICLKFL